MMGVIRCMWPSFGGLGQRASGVREVRPAGTDPRRLRPDFGLAREAQERGPAGNCGASFVLGFDTAPAMFDRGHGIGEVEMNLNSLRLEILLFMSGHFPAFIVGSPWFMRMLACELERHGMFADQKYLNLMADLRESGREPNQREADAIRNWWSSRYDKVLDGSRRHRDRRGQ